MLKLFRYILSTNRKHRRFAIGFALPLLRLIRDIERDETYRYSDKLDELDLDSANVSLCEYNAIEENYTICEHTLDFLDSAIEDLEFAY